MNPKVEKIINMIIQIRNWSVPRGRYKEAYEELSVLTRDAWNDFHTELLLELKNLNKYGTKDDFQRLWFDSLGFPPETPMLYDLEGKQIGLGYGFLPSDFNNICFHDSNIKNIEFGERLILDLGMVDFCMQDKNWHPYNAKLKFYNVAAILYREYDNKNKNFKYINFDPSKLLGGMVLSIIEIPPLDYVFRHLEIAEKYHFKDKRMFGFTLWSDDGVILFADRWELDEDK